MDRLKAIQKSTDCALNAFIFDSGHGLPFQMVKGTHYSTAQVIQAILIQLKRSIWQLGHVIEK